MGLFLIHLLTLGSLCYTLGMYLSAWSALSHSLAEQPNKEGVILQIRKMRLIYMKQLAHDYIYTHIHVSQSLKRTTTFTKAALSWDLFLPAFRNLIPQPYWETLGKSLNFSKGQFSHRLKESYLFGVTG